MAVNFTELKIDRLKKEIVKLSVEIKDIEEGKHAYCYAADKICFQSKEIDRLYRKIIKDTVQDLIHRINGMLEEIYELEKERSEED